MPPLSEATVNDVHSPASGGAVSVGDFISRGEYTFVKFRGHAYESADPHPEDGSRASHYESYGYAGDIAHTDSRSDDRGEGL